MAKVEAIKRTKNQQVELVHLYKEDKEWDALPNDDDTVNKEDDSGYESDNWGEPWKNYKDEKCIINNELKIVLQKHFEDNTVWDFSYLKTWFNQEKFVYPIHVIKFTHHGWRKKI